MTPTNHFPGNYPHAAQRTSLVTLGKSLWQNRRLIAQMTRREVMVRYKGSAMGMAWMLASLDEYLRDVGQTIGIFTMVILFLSPVFYPVTALPEEFRPWLMANPLTFIIEQAREVLIWGHLPNWMSLGGYTLAATAIAWTGYSCFQKTRKGFADVL